MQANLTLVKPRREMRKPDESREIQFRYPSEEPLWEISCGESSPKSRASAARPLQVRRAG